MNIPDGWNKLAENKQAFKTTTNNGTVLWMLDTHNIEDLIGGVIFSFLARVDGLPTTWEDVGKMTGIDPSQFVEVELELGSDEIIQETDRAIAEAVEYIRDNSAAMFAEAVDNFIIESVFKSLMKRDGKGYFVFKATENDVFKELIKLQLAAARSRLDVKKASGAKLYWTPDRKRELLQSYEKNLASIRDAKKDYRACSKFANWRDTIKQKYSHLPDWIIEEMALPRGGSEPSVITLKLIAPYFDGASPDYLLKILAEARRDTEKD